MSPQAPCVRASVAMLAALALAAGCGASAPAGSPAISAAAQAPANESPMSDLLPPSEWPDATVAPERVAPTTATAVLPTIPAVDGPATVLAEPDPVVGDPRGVEAMALIAFPWQRTLPGWSIAFLPARAGLRGLAKADDRRIEIYVRDSDSAQSLARVVAHELGHAVDVELNSPSDRERWRAARGVAPAVSWWPGNAVSDFDTLAGDFAEAFSTLLTGSVSLSRVAPAPGPAALAVLVELVTR